MAVLYRVSATSYWIGRALVRVPHVAMVNILAGERVVPEFLQGEARAERILPVVEEWLRAPEKLAAIREKLQALRPLLGEAGASERAAEEVLRVAGGKR